MRRECRERFSSHRFQRKPLDTHAVMHVGIANPRGGENVPGIPSAWTTRNFTFLARCPWQHISNDVDRIIPDRGSLTKEGEEKYVACQTLSDLVI